jgi:spermidine synthase
VAPWTLAPLLFVSGFCALVYQVGWQREFRLIFGASTAASACVVAVFMGGLGLGGRVLGPWVDRRADPLRAYALLEALVAVGAAASPILLGLTRAAYVGLGGTASLGPWGGTAVRLALAALVLLPPTFLAGGTLGAAARALEGGRDRRRRATAMLYGVNTLGAVAGCVAATFAMLETFGTRRTLWLAALVNAFVAVIAWMRAGPRGQPETADEPAMDREAAAPPAFVLTAAAAVGFAFFLMELVWYRMLGPILGGTVYTFGLVLAVALLGIGLGAFLYALAFARIAVTLEAFAVTCLLEAALVGLPYALGDRLALLALRLRPAVDVGGGLASYLTGWGAVTAITVLPASIVAGAQFPLLVALLGEGRERVARHLGLAYSWNTVGGIVGALAGGFGLLPLLTAPGCWRLSAWLLALLALGAVMADRGRPRWAIPAIGVGCAAVTLLLTRVDGPTAAWRHSGIGAGRASALQPGANGRRAWINDERRTLIWEREGVESSVAVQGRSGLALVLNGKIDGNARGDAPTQVMGGLLGCLLRPPVRHSLVIGLGTGSTAGWLAAVPGMERVDVLELEPAVLEVARMCASVNLGAMANPRVRVTIADAREALLTGRERYELVFSEPSNPYRAGVASLFTREFYEAAAARLQTDGVFLQWLQAYEVDEQTVSTVLATLASVFPYVEVWQVHDIDLVLVGSRRPLRNDAAALAARTRTEPFATALRVAWRATDLHDVLARFVAGPALAARLRDTGEPVNTDDRNLVEFSFARTVSRRSLFDISWLRRAAAALGAERPSVDGAVDWERVRRQRLAVYTVADVTAPIERGTPEPDVVRARAHATYLVGWLREAVKLFQSQSHPPEGAVETALFAEGLAEAGDPAAVPHLQAMVAVEPVEARAAAARLALRTGRPEQARDALVSAFVQYRVDPWPTQSSMRRALRLAEEVATVRPDLAPSLFEATSEPFAAGAVGQQRKFTRVLLTAVPGMEGRCREAFAALEPFVPWTEELLRRRVACYGDQGPHADRARAELAEFRSHLTPPASPPAPSPSPPAP